MDADNVLNNRQLDEQAIILRWEQLANEGKSDEILADAVDVLGLQLSDPEYINRVFHGAIRYEARSLATLFVSLGARIDEEGGYTPLHTAITSPRSGNMVEWLLEKGANPNAVILGDRPLHLAVKQDNADAIKSLITHGADLNATDLDHGYTPLELAASLGRVDLVKLLIDSGATQSMARIESLAAKRSKSRIMEIIKKKRDG